jgi:VWFA-related protein
MRPAGGLSGRLTGSSSALIAAALLLLLLPAQLRSQQAAPTDGHAVADAAQLDVVVEDAAGQPIHGLQVADFQLQIDGKLQPILRAEEHCAENADADPPMPTMPPGIYTDYTPVAPGATLNVLLYDALNTPAKDQIALREQLRSFVEHAPPDSHLAILGLANQLILLQGFTSNPATLRAVVEHRLIPRPGELLASPARDSPRATGALQPHGDLLPSGPAGSAPDMTQVAANMQEFDAQLRSPQQSMHAQYTLDALDTLAHYLAAFPGRKNVFWFSGTFPAQLLTSLSSTAASSSLDPTETQETRALLAQGHIAVYPIMLWQAASQPAKQSANESVMAAFAAATGGRALLTASSLVDGVTQALREGSSFYTLTYAAPSSAAARHSLRVALKTTAKDNAQLFYQRIFSAPLTNATTDAQRRAYARAALARGAPEPQQMLFKARVRLASAGMETKVAPGNDLDPLVRSTGPFHRYNVDIATTPADITLTPEPDGTHVGSVIFTVLVYNRDGRLLNSISKRYEMKLKPETYSQFMSTALLCHLEVSTPDAADSFLRIAVEDQPSHRIGVVEVPASDVRSLPPIHEDAPTPTPSTAWAPAPTAPSTSAVPRITPPTRPER